ncbi:MAG TPA: PAS domain-containing protein [Syntrophorhabdaceae bacterium]|jgi:PAS domain S-box-containing protein
MNQHESTAIAGSPVPPSDYRALFETTPDPCLVLDTGLDIVEVNDAYLRVTMTKRAEIIGRHIFDVFPDNPEEADPTGVRNLSASLERVLREGRTDTMALQKYDIRKPASEGGGFEERYWSPVNTPVLGPENEIRYILHRVQDVTEFVHLKEKGVEAERLTEELREWCVQTEAELYLRAQEIADANLEIKRSYEEMAMKNALIEKCKIALESITDGFVSFDKEWRYIYVNDTALRLLQKPREELLGHTPWEVFPESPHLKFYTEFIRSCDRDMPVHFEEFYPSPLDRWFECHCYPEPEGLSVYFRDVTERKAAAEALRSATENLETCVQERTMELQKTRDRLESELAERARVEEQLRQAQKMEAIGTFAGGIAHDFNNILAGILGFTEMAMDDIPSNCTQVEKNLQRVLTSALRARDLIKQILAFSRKATHEKSPMSVSPVIKETVRLLKAFIPSNINLTVTITATSDTVLASPVELQQILMNLSANAVLAMEGGGNTLGISLEDVELQPDSPRVPKGLTPGEYLGLVVRDNGTGISPEVREKMFEPFFTTREEGKGTGMGLSVVYGLVKGLGGAIVVESEPGVGSTFHVILPKIKWALAPENLQEMQLPGGSERILFVEDEEMLVEWGRITLERLGYRVTAAADSARALDLFSTDPSRFDLVITDQNMPGITGAHLSEEILKIRPDIPIILSTGHSDAISPEKAKAIGIKEFLMKPLSRSELAAAVRRVLDAKSQKRCDKP